jgi:hypothetical protein
VTLSQFKKADDFTPVFFVREDVRDVSDSEVDPEPDGVMEFWEFLLLLLLLLLLILLVLVLLLVLLLVLVEEGVGESMWCDCRAIPSISISAI